MLSIESYLCPGEKIIYSLSRGRFLGREELAATDRRIIHIRNGRCRDIDYGFLASIESGMFVDWKWGRRALYAVLASMVFAGIGLAMPSFIIRGANWVSDFSNSLVAQMMSAVIPPAYQGQGSSMPGLSGLNFNLMPGLQANVARVDLSGPAGSISMSITSAFTILTALAVALSALCLLAFVIQIKRGLVLTTPMDKHVFYYGRGQEKNIIELIKLLRAETDIKNIKFRKA